ncbi:MAG: GreA/GreB family elongation factor [bacterium]|nr:GreA/GreB family elongation factor [bacterium]
MFARHQRAAAVGAGAQVEETSSQIDIGSKVTVRLNGTVRSFRIVPGTSDPSRKEVSASAPLARAILGRRRGDVCSLVVHPPTTISVIITDVVCE